MTDYRDHIAWAQAQDRHDALAAYREQFHFPLDTQGTKTIYLAGNSLGLQPVRAGLYVVEELEDWAKFGVEGHFHGRRPWMPYHEQLTGLSGRLVGAGETEVVCMNTLTVNLHLLMVSFYRPAGTRTRILIEKPAFPSDRYAVVSQLRFHGLDPAEHLIEIAPRANEHHLRDEDIADTIEQHGREIALILLPGVQYYSGQVLDMAAITKLARQQGCKVGFDLAHAAGNIELALHDWNVDFAAWCTYKYLNAGPGAIAGAYVHERYASDKSLPRFAGWWGHDKSSRFRMGPDFNPIPGAEGWQISNPPILSMAPVLASLEIFDQVGMQALLDKSNALTGYLAWLIAQKLDRHIEVITPEHARGCQLSLRLRQPELGKDTQEKLVERGVLCDWREPDVIRVAPVPLYNRYTDVYHFVQILEELLTA
ncbi:MAG: kynureninase [Gammaproteobacteria bacterium]|nr:kynureninase [Gammaproteobacteria bacterium]NNM20245.1 kynureninase [Gammaproteobacteria bacterium]